MPNDNLLTDERVAAAKNIVAAWVQSRKTFIDGEAYGAAVELVAFALARNPGQPEPRAEMSECCNHTWESCHKGDGCEFRIWLDARTGASS
ncbi:hypothetical protein [Burkholderia cepacia]|uniref:Uncharacterized protein n=1 Tax=Burkholderia cepacia TaxID=292 RepID=A0ABN5D108_BURCE|nr:hypothetical protein [Burkholderia cepacia]AIO27398.1 hypothetical protein DM41_6156 [Burkholderia cepacia ATCC 25416]ALK22108.1 hypothetical protein APZ15_30910 [Burkholderia cepacia ATCC 25416]ASE97822.1 hypothetical protein CEQ23_30835 [Burkholderia cepacia]ATF81216.1 hypothetical protein CO711_28030 [Burkholderia cepacia]MCA8464311.1 hypothetical protein [Burkholderia cepacia]